MTKIRPFAAGVEKVLHPLRRPNRGLARGHNRGIWRAITARASKFKTRQKTLFLGGAILAHASLCQYYPSIHVATFLFGVAFWSIWKRAIFFHLYKRALIFMSISRSTFHT